MYTKENKWLDTLNRPVYYYYNYYTYAYTRVGMPPYQNNDDECSTLCLRELSV